MSTSFLASLLPAERPARVCTMRRSGAKYLPYAGAFGVAEIEQHLAGRATFATTLQDQLGRAAQGVIDVDQGGREALHREYYQVRAAGLQSWCVSIRTEGGHDGGHIFLAFDAWYPAADIRALLLELAPGHEVWPAEQVIRLPFGYHVRARTFGELAYLDDAGELHTFDLDDTAQRGAALALVASLPRNPAPPAAPAPEAPQQPAQPRPAPRVSLGEQGAERLSAREAIDRFNRENPLSGMLTPGAGGLRHCDCGGHSSGKPKIVIWAGPDGVERAQSFSSDCRWFPLHKSGKYLDPFGYYVIRYHAGDRTAALRAINPAPERAQRPQAEPPHPAEAPEYLTPQQVERRAADAARKRQQRRQETEQRLAAARRVFDARTLKARAHAVLGQLLLECERTGTYTCRPSNAALAERIGISERTVTTAFADLEAAGLGQRVGGRNVGGKAETAVWTFGAADAPSSQVCDLIDHENMCTRESGACEGGAPPPAAEVRDEPPPIELQLDAGDVAEVLDAHRRPQFTWKDRWVETDAGRQALAERWKLRDDAPAELDAGDVAEQRQLAAEVCQAVPAVVFGPPSDPAQRTEYHKLLGAARKAERAGQEGKAYALRQRARALEEARPAAADEPQAQPASTGAAPPPRSHAPPRLELLPPIELPPASQPFRATGYHGPSGDVSDPAVLAMVAQLRARYAAPAAAAE